MRCVIAVELFVAGLVYIGLSPISIATDDHSRLSSSSANRYGGGGGGSSSSDIPMALFASLERMSRVVDIAYCVGTSGISHPFACVSRCRDFPSFELFATWNTGPLLTDSCGYIALDRGNGSASNVADGPAIVVAFRGTYSLINTIVDLATVPQEYVPYPSPPDHEPGRDPAEPLPPRCLNCTVHAGFMMSWRNARSVVLPHLLHLRHLYPHYPIHLVGHSLGGAVAALAALEMRLSLGWWPVIVTTFGEPRIGNAGLVRFIDHVFLRGDTGAAKSAFRRVTHRDDVVPLLPVNEWGYRPHAGEIYITKLELAPSPADLRLCDGDADPSCISTPPDLPGLINQPSLGRNTAAVVPGEKPTSLSWNPAWIELRHPFFAHRDYFWRLGLCVPGGDPTKWDL